MIYVPIGYIDDNPFQPRQVYHDDEVEALAESIAASTLLQAPAARLVYAEDGTLAEDAKHKLIRVVKDVQGFLDENQLRVQLAFGHKRFRAMRLLDERRGEDLIGKWPRGVQWGTMPLSRLEALNDLAMADAAMEENDKRSDVSAVEVAAALQLRIETFGLTQEQAGDRYGYTRASVSNLLRLLKLPESVQAMNRDGLLAQGTARAILPLVDAWTEHPTVASELWDSGTVPTVEEAGDHIARRGMTAELARQFVLDQVRTITFTSREKASAVAPELPLETKEASPEASGEEKVMIPYSYGGSVLGQEGRVTVEVESLGTIEHEGKTFHIAMGVVHVREDGTIAQGGHFAVVDPETGVNWGGRMKRDQAIEYFKERWAELGGVAMPYDADPYAADDAPEASGEEAPDLPKVVATVDRLVAVYNTADSWRTGKPGGRPEDVGADVVRATLEKLTSALKEAWRLRSDLVDAGLDPSTTPEGRWTVTRLCERLEADVETYQRILDGKVAASKTAPEASGGAVEGGAAQEGAEKKSELDMLRAVPTKRSGVRVRWTKDGWPWEPQVNAFHALGGMTKAELAEVIQKHDVSERRKYGTDFLRSGKRDHHFKLAEEVTRYHANLKASLRLTSEQADELFRWIDQKRKDGRYSLPWAVAGHMLAEVDDVQKKVDLMPRREMWRAYVDVMARRMGAFCYHLFLRETEGTRTRYPVEVPEASAPEDVSADTSEASGDATGDAFDAPAFVTGRLAPTTKEGLRYHQRGGGETSAPIETCQYPTVTKAVEGWIGRRKDRTLADVAPGLSNGALFVDRVTPEGVERLTKDQVQTALAGGIVAAVEA
ncbi:MAG: hypothetical protein AAFQ43_00485 [Bacteroidota bacterium]